MLVELGRDVVTVGLVAAMVGTQAAGRTMTRSSEPVGSGVGGSGATA